MPELDLGFEGKRIGRLVKSRPQHVPTTHRMCKAEQLHDSISTSDEIRQSGLPAMFEI